MLSSETDIVAMRPAVPAKDYAESLRFYETVGFQSRALGPTLMEMRLGQYSFLLQDFYVPEFANNFVMHMLVGNVDDWWAHIEERADVKCATPIPGRMASIPKAAGGRS